MASPEQKELTLKTCTEAEARKIWTDTIDEWASTRPAIKHWTFHFNNNKRRRGVCKYGSFRVEISRNLLFMGREEVKSTILHEFAHVMAGYENGHNAVWQQWAVRVGGSPNRCGRGMPVEYRWKATCFSCKKVVGWHRRPRYWGVEKTYQHPPCGHNAWITFKNNLTATPI